MKNGDTINFMSGILSVSAYDRENKLLWTDKSHNLIVMSGYNAVAKALAGVPDMYISKVAVGTNGNPAQESDTHITDAVLINIKSIEYPKPVTVRFYFEIGYDEAVGVNIREFGLIINTGQLFSRKVREVIEKTQYFRIVGMWDVNICDSETPLTEDVEYNNDYNNDYPSDGSIGGESDIQLSTNQLVFDAAGN